MRIKIYPPLAIQELGNRDNQEDYIYPAHGKATASDCLFIVCDGMGGHENGEVASQTFAEALADYFRAHATCDTVLQDSVIAAALDHAYTKLDAADNGSYKKMGTTLTLLYFHRGGVTAAHIGDSRIYHLRPGKKLLYVSRDHSLVFDLYQSGEISYGEMKTSMQKNVITRAVQPGEDNRVKPDIIHITDVKPGDYFFMCSDGMVERMDDDDILNLFSGHGDDEKKMKKLISATASNQDNHSAYIIHVESVTIESEDELNTVNEENTARFNVLNMKPINANSTSIEEDDNDSTVVAPSTPSKPERTQRRKKKQSSWIWALLIAAIVAAAAWLALYGWGGTHEKEMPGETAPVIENNSVQNVEPTKPITSTVNHKPKPQRVNVVEPAAEASAASQQSTIDRYRDSVKESRKRHHAATASADDNEKKSEND